MEERRRWEDMEMDCLVNIIRRLSLEDLALGVPFVCKGWQRASMEPLCWSILDFRDLDFMPWSDLTKKFTARYAVQRFSFSGFLKFALARSCGFAVELQFPLVFGASFQDLVFASEECPRLKTLVLPNILLADEPLIPQLVGKWKELEKLEMELKPSSFSEMVMQINLNCRRFSGLRMFGSIKKEDVKAIIKYLPKIKHLNLSKSYLQKEELVEIIKGCRELETLSVNNCIGFEADEEEVLRRASAIKNFENEGSKLFDESAYDMDECDPLNVLVI
ncbi:hypothetical protein Cni_G05796 [Canna indica]|uniref:F-box/LRR-repeat protein n=1 Tax=Canna indica TaxID=4628 RepID=A0AAQ3Q444_9LILI|nr:hypothetical protein Cni_G05796 [Canna indica]